MSRPLQELKLPKSGYTAHFITYWSWGEKQEITKVLLGGTTIDPQNGAVSDVLASNGIELNRKSLEMAVKKLVDQEGNEVAISELFDLPEADVSLLVAKLQKIDEDIKKN